MIRGVVFPFTLEKEQGSKSKSKPPTRGHLIKVDPSGKPI